ncbi:hypothetical protein MMO10_27670, partial [Escherichia coli]|nr:hypothetical protein [Escherichia coli]
NGTAIIFIGYFLLVMNLVSQESSPQKGTDSQTGILKGHPERFFGLFTLVRSAEMTKAPLRCLFMKQSC